MEKLSGVLILLVLAALAGGCGGSSKSSAPATKGATTSVAPSGHQLEVGLAPDVSGLNDRGFNHLAYVGVQDAKAKLGVKYRVFSATSAADYIPNFTSFAQQGYDLTIGVGYTEASAIEKAARKFPHRNFAIVDVDQTSLPGKPKNLLGLLFREQEVGYLAGYLAALEERRRPGPDAIGAVGGEKQPPIDRFLAGYQAGATAADPGIKVIIAYANDPTFADQAKCKDVALNQIAAGAGVVFQVAGGCGLGVITAAKDKNVWAIGVDADQAYIDPHHILTSATKHVDVAVFKAIQSVKDGKFKGGNVIYGLKDNGVGLGKINPRVPNADVAKVDKVRQQIVAGKVSIPTSLK
jgi:basic membrane protein A and related proteins